MCGDVPYCRDRVSRPKGNAIAECVECLEAPAENFPAARRGAEGKARGRIRDKTDQETLADRATLNTLLSPGYRSYRSYRAIGAIGLLSDYYRTTFGPLYRILIVR